MTDLETLLRGSGPDLHLDRPLGDVLARGRALRRRRWSATSAVAVVMVAVVGLSTTWLTRDGGPGPAASSGPAMIRLSAAVLRFEEAACRRGVIHATPARLRRGPLRLFAAGDTAAGVILLYHDERSTTVCHSGGGGTNGVGEAPGPGREITSASYGRKAPDGTVSTLIAYGRVDASVARVVGTVYGRRIDAAIGDGWYWLETPGRGDPLSQGPLLRLRAYDAAGHLLSLITVTSV